MVEKSIKPNGFAVKSWGDIIAVATLLSMFLGVVAWGLKLEASLDIERERSMRLQNQIMVIQERIKPGILQVADSRMNDISRRIDRLEADIVRLRNNE